MKQLFSPEQSVRMNFISLVILGKRCRETSLFLLMPYRKPRVYSGLNAKVLEQHRSTPTSVVKPKVCILNRTPGLPGDIYACYLWLTLLSKMLILNAINL